MALHILSEQYNRAPVLNLGQTVLLVFPGVDSDLESNPGNRYASNIVDHPPSRVVQVTIEPAEDGVAVRQSDIIAAFFFVQHEISELIVSVLRASCTHPFPNQIKFVQHEGPALYELSVETRPWPFGKTMGLLWGQERLVPSAVKWTFKFALLNEVDDAT